MATDIPNVIARAVMSAAYLHTYLKGAKNDRKND
jgi:hypothetical protein